MTTSTPPRLGIVVSAKAELTNAKESEVKLVSFLVIFEILAPRSIYLNTRLDDEYQTDCKI